MVDITRRGFLTKTSLTVGAVGVGLASGNALRQMVVSGGGPKATAAALASNAPAAQVGPARISLAGMSLPDSMIVHVRDASTGELSVMVGTQEVVVHDQEIVARLVQAAGPAAFAEA